MKNLIVWSAFVMLLIGCNRNYDKRYLPINPAVKAFFNYEVGSYWIMQDSLTGDLDSLTVTENVLSTVQTSDDNEEAHDIRIDDFHGTPTHFLLGIRLDRGQAVSFGIYTTLSDTAYRFIELWLDAGSLTGTDLTQGGMTYHGVLTKSMIGASYPALSHTDTLDFSMNKEYGFISIDTRTATYQRRWKLIRSKVIL